MPHKRRKKGKDKGHEAPEAQRVSVGAVKDALAQGNIQEALHLAKLLLKGYRGPEGEECLAEAYKERIRQLQQGGLVRDAENLAEVAKSKCPHHKKEFEVVLAETFQFPLSREDVRRIAALLNRQDAHDEAFMRVSAVLREGLGNPRYLLECRELPQEHPLKKEATLVCEAFEAAAGDAPDDERDRRMAQLAHVSRRSPLSVWCLFIRALDAYHRSDHARAEALLERIPKHSVLAPAAMILESKSRNLEKPSGLSSKPTRDLWRAMSPDSPRSQWVDLVEALKSRDRKQIRDTVQGILRSKWMSSPMMVRAAVCAISREMIESDVSDDYLIGDMMHAMQRAWGHNARMLCFLDASELLRDADPIAAADDLESLERLESGSLTKKERAMILSRAAEFASEGENEMAVPLPFFRSALKANHSNSVRLYQRAWRLDPQPEYFEPLISLMREEERKPTEIEETLSEWWKACPNDSTPLIHLFRDAENRGAFQKALKFLVEAEAIDPLDPKVREARQRLVWQAALKHLKQRKLHLVERDLSQVRPAEMSPVKRALFAGLNRFLALARDEPDPGQADWNPAFATVLLHHLNHATQVGVEERLDRVAPLGDLSDGPSLAAYYDLRDALATVGDGLAVPMDWYRRLPEWIGRAPHLTEDLLLRISRTVLTDSVPSAAFAATARGLEQEGPRLHEFLYYRALILLKIHQYRDSVNECLRATIALCRARGDCELERQAMKVLKTAQRPLPYLGIFDVEDDKPETEISEKDLAEVIRRERRRKDPLLLRSKARDRRMRESKTAQEKLSIGLEEGSFSDEEYDSFDSESLDEQDSRESDLQQTLW